MSDDLDVGLGWIMVDSRVTLRGPSSPPEFLNLSIRLWSNFGVTTELEIETLASLAFPKLPSSLYMSAFYVNVEKGLAGIEFIWRMHYVIKSLLVDLGRWMASALLGRPVSVQAKITNR